MCSCTHLIFACCVWCAAQDCIKEMMREEGKELEDGEWVACVSKMRMAWKTVLKYRRMKGRRTDAEAKAHKVATLFRLLI